MSSSRFPRLIICCAALIAMAPAPLRALTVLMPTENNGSLTSEESAHKTQFEAWGWTVTTIWDADTQANYNTAVTNVDVVFIPESIISGDLNTKLRTTTKGVVIQEPALDDEFGLSTNGAGNVDATQINILTITHPITAGVTATGLRTVLSSTRAIPAMSATIASSFVALANTPGGVANFGYIETGGTLANTLVSNNVASGRRVRLFVGSGNGSNPFVFSALNATGLTLMKQAIVWAAGKETLRAHWKVNETSGTTLVDASDYRHDATVSGNYTLNAVGMRHRALTLNSSGTNGQASAPNNTLSALTNVSSTFWLKTTRTGSQNVFSASNSSDDNEFRVDINSPTSLTVYYHNVTASWTITSIADGRWHHFAIVSNSSTNQTTLYVDNVSQGVRTLSPNGTPLVVSSGGFLIGQEQDCVGGCLDANQIVVGSLDDLRIYAKTLTAAEVAEIYGLVGHWKLDETSGTTVADSSGLGNNGTVTGTATWTAGARGNGFSADYTNGYDYIQIPNSNSLENVQEESYSLACFFKPTNLPPGTGDNNHASYGLIRKSGWHCGLQYSAEGYLFLEHWLAPTPSWSGAGAWNVNAPGRFYHLASVVDRDAGSIKFYLDGSLVDSIAFTAGTAAYEFGTEPWRIGVSNPTGSTWAHPARGVIDDVRIYNRTLTVEEVAELSGLVGHWKLDETSGTTAADSSGLGNSGTLTNGATPNVTAIYNGGDSFDGVNDFVNVPNTNNHVNLRESMTVSCWARSHTTNWNQTGCLVSKRDQFVLHPWSGGKSFDFYINSGGWTSASTNLANISNFDLMAWHHYVGVYNHVTGQIQVFVDGVQRATNSITAGSTLTSDTGPITIGYDDGMSGRYFDGDMDDVRIYNRALPASEIAELYGLKYWYKFDETSGSTATDSGPYNNNATVNVGAASWITGRSGNALAFNGASSFISGLNIFPPTTGSVAFWMRVAGSNATHGRIFGSAGDYEMRHVTAATAEGVPYGLVADLHIAADNFQFVTSTAVNAPSKWYYVVAVYNETNDTYNLYLDGVLHASGTRTLTASGAAQLTLGNRTGAADYYNGDLEDLQIYQRELSAAEVLAKYRELKPPGIRLIKWIEVR